MLTVKTETRIIIGASAYASIKYTTDSAEEFHCGTIDIKLPGGRGASADLRRIADEYREKAARMLRHVAICEAAAVELDMQRAAAVAA